MDKINIVTTCLTKSDLSVILARISSAQYVYNQNLEEYLRGQKTDVSKILTADL